MASQQDKIGVIELESLALSKIIKHCRENVPSKVYGQLLGLDIGTTLKISNCYAFPVAEENVAEHEEEMKRLLRMLNDDNNVVGWYASGFLGSFVTTEFVRAMYNRQRKSPRSIVVVFDPAQTASGRLSIHAFRLTETFMALFKGQNFTPGSLSRTDVLSKDVLEAIPVTLKPALYDNALLLQLQESYSEIESTDVERLDASFNPYLERNLEHLLEGLDTMTAELGKFQYYQRNLFRQQAQQQAFINRKRAAGEQVTPEDMAQNPAYRTIQAPSRLESLLVSQQIRTHCDQINDFSSHSARKLFLINNLHK